MRKLEKITLKQKIIGRYYRSLYFLRGVYWDIRHPLPNVLFRYGRSALHDGPEYKRRSYGLEITTQRGGINKYQYSYFLQIGSYYIGLTVYQKVR